MKHMLDLFSWQGRVTRREYLAAGVILFGIKYAIDSAVAYGFGQQWNIFDYVSPRVSPLLHPAENPGFWVALLAVALPFIGAGVSLTARRLRDAGVDPFWCGLFFLPFVHWALFLALAAAPSRADEAPELKASPERVTRRFQKQRELGAGPRFLIATIASIVFGCAGYAFGVYGTKTDMPFLPSKELLGVGLFIGVPFGMGFWSGYVCGFDNEKGLGLAIASSLVSFFASLAVLLGAAAEGLGCLVIVLPLLSGVSVFGAVIGWACTRATVARVAAVIGIAVPAALLGKDAASPPEPEAFACVSVVRVEAPPEVVWNNVVSFPPIDSEPDPIFAIVAMPLEAKLDGRDPGATRHCVFTIGEFEEPIETWDEPRELTFRVRAQPTNIERLIAVERGQFLLERNGDGTTTIRGTTWYRLRTAPFCYFGLWSQRLLHAIHMRVLDHVKRLSEHPGASRARAPAAPPAWMKAANETCECTRKPG